MSSISVIFLDFDGVINSWNFWHSINTDFFWDVSDILDPDCLARINWLVEETGAKVVVSSSWRLLHSKEELQDFITTQGGKFEIFDVTPALGRAPRGHEIRLWIDRWQKENNQKIKSFVVLDDDSDMDTVTDNFVKTDNAFGLTQEHAERALSILLGNNQIVVRRKAGKATIPIGCVRCPACSGSGWTTQQSICPWCEEDGFVSSNILSVFNRVRAASPFEFVKVFGPLRG